MISKSIGSGLLANSKVHGLPGELTRQTWNPFALVSAEPWDQHSNRKKKIADRPRGLTIQLYESLLFLVLEEMKKD